MKLNKHKNSLILNIIKTESKQMNRCLAVSFFTFKYGIHIVKKNTTNHTKHMSNVLHINQCPHFSNQLLI